MLKETGPGEAGWPPLNIGDSYMTKSELIEILAAKNGHLNHKDVELAVKSLIEQMSQSLPTGNRIEIRGFGSFSLHYRPPRMGRNPKTGQEIPITALAGPGRIFQFAWLSASQGISKFLIFLTLISANLAVINFLPIPVLDGGHFVFLLYEGVRRKPADERIQLALSYLGLLLILTLMLWVIGLDILWWLGIEP